MIFMTYSMPSFTRLLQGVNGVNYRTISRNGIPSTAITICGEINQTRQLITVLIGIGWIAMVAISRVYLRDHYLSDVLASVCLASGWWLLVTPAEAFIQAKMRQFLPEGMLKSWPHQN